MAQRIKLDIKKIELYYKIEEDGSVWSYRLKRYICPTKCGSQYAYYYVCLKDAGMTCVSVHKLVASKYLGDCPDGKEISHRDGNKWNNKCENLEWITASDNSKHAYETGLISHKGEKHNLAKLSTEDVLEIRRLYEEDGLTLAQIASLYDVCFQHVGGIINKKKWVHV